MTNEQAIKVAGPQREGAQDKTAGYKSSGPREGGKHRTIELSIKVAGSHRSHFGSSHLLLLPPLPRG